MKIALVHDYLTQPGGAERVFELLCKRYPNADIFTSLYEPKRTIDLGEREVRTTVLQKVPGASKNFRLMAPFYFSAFRALDLKDYDLIISSTTSFAKAVRKRPGATHICFCHNVTRFLWDTTTYLRDYATYRNLSGMLEPIFQQMRKADLDSAQDLTFTLLIPAQLPVVSSNFMESNQLLLTIPLTSKNLFFPKIRGLLLDLSSSSWLQTYRCDY
jgi:hypothetical protein